MSTQKFNGWTIEQGKILDLEKKYFEYIENIITSQSFIKDLKKIENRIKNQYQYLEAIWDLKNKLKIPAERLLRYYIYKQPNVIGFYPSPVSCDVAVETNDVILNIDVKTIDIVGNSGDITTIQLEHNQCSFKHKNVLSNGDFKGFEIKTNLPSIDKYTKKPILTYLLKIVYSDNDKEFDIFYPNNKRKIFPIITLTCLPNGCISNLFDNDLFSNFKNYDYYKSTDGSLYKPKFICSKDYYDNISIENEKYLYIKHQCNIPNDWSRVKILNKCGYYDKVNNNLWITVSRGTKKNGWDYYLEAVKSPHTCRFDYTMLKTRYDSKGNKWNGIKSYYIKDMTID